MLAMPDDLRDLLRRGPGLIVAGGSSFLLGKRQAAGLSSSQSNFTP